MDYKFSYDWVNSETVKDISKKQLMRIIKCIRFGSGYDKFTKVELAQKILSWQDDNNPFLNCSERVNMIWIYEEVDIWGYINKD